MYYIMSMFILDDLDISMNGEMNDDVADVQFGILNKAHQCSYTLTQKKTFVQVVILRFIIATLGPSGPSQLI